MSTTDPDSLNLSHRPEGSPTCVGCHKHPEEILEYKPEHTGEDMTPDVYVRREEGTYCSLHNTFWCTSCYINAGMPLGKAPAL